GVGRILLRPARFLVRERRPRRDARREAEPPIRLAPRGRGGPPLFPALRRALPGRFRVGSSPDRPVSPQGLGLLRRGRPRGRPRRQLLITTEADEKRREEGIGPFG